MIKVNICGLEHTVRYYDDAFNVDDHWGMIDYAKCEIRINKNMNLAAQEETLCHEIVHGILVHIGYDELSQDEQFVQALGNAIFQSFTVKKVQDEYEQRT